MYTVDDKYQDEEEYTKVDNNGSWQENKGLIIKVIIIILCVIALILLISSLKKSNDNVVAYDPNVHNANIVKVRLASERYYFMDNLPSNNETKKVTLQTLKEKKLLDDVIDSNAKVCSNSESYVTLTNDKTTYILKIKLSCTKQEKEETFFYSKDNYACLNCNGNTYMDGKADINDDTINKYNYSCKIWSEWSSERVNDLSLSERTRVLVKGVKRGKKGETITYGEWSEFTEEKIEERDDIEIETKKVVENRWSEEKTTNSQITDSATIKVLNTTRTGGGSYTYCPDGYTKKGDKCISDKPVKGDLNYIEYNTYNITNKPCDDVRVEKNSDGKYETVYKGCLYTKEIDVKKGKRSGTVTYTYQELVPTEVTYYRYRTIKKEVEFEDDIYTDGYYEESKLPYGYEKLDGSEKTEYSYKITVCEK